MGICMQEDVVHSNISSTRFVGQNNIEKWIKDLVNHVL